MTWEALSDWYNDWLAADEAGRERLRGRLASEHPDIVADADALAAASGHLSGFLETSALLLAAHELAHDDPLLSTDELVGPYRLVHLLARGGSGDVYRATDTRLQRDVAVKVLAHSRTGDPQRVERFMQEARVTAGLDHPNIVRVYDVGRFEERAYLVAELLEGETLRTRINRGPIQVDDVVRIGIEVGRGLIAAHAAGLVHRDLKPDNIFLTQSGPTKILDFGIAKLAQTSGSQDGLSTVTGVVLGTAGYLAPEQIRGEPTDARADLFALGSVLFEMLTGTRAFGRDHIVETLHAILHDAPPDLLGDRDDLPAPLVELVLKLLEKSPDARPSSAEDVITALQQIPLDGAVRQPRVRPVPRPTPPVEIVRSPPRSNRRAAVAAVLVITLLAAAIVLKPWRVLLGDPAQPRLAVMPFDLTPASDGNELLGLGLAALLSDRLGQQLSNISVLAAVDTRGWQTKDAAEATRRLTSTHVLSGRVARDSGRTRVTAEVFSSADGRIITIEPLDISAGSGPVEDAIVAHLVPRIASALALGAPSAAPPKRASSNAQANEKYLRARALVLRPDAADLKTAAGYFGEAIKLDPEFADSWAGLASAYKRMPITGAMPAKEAFPLADKSAREALRLDPNNAEAYAALGTKAFWYDWDYAGAEEHLKRAIALQPSHADSHLFLGHLYSNVGRPEEALREIRQTRTLDPIWPQPRALEGQFLAMARKYDESLAFLDAVTRDTDPTLWTAHAFRAEALLALNRPADAFSAYERAAVPELRPSPFHHAQRGYYLARLGRIEEAQAAMASLPPRQNYARAMILHALGRREEAVAELHRAVDDKMVIVTFLGIDWKWDSLRDWEPFREVVQRVNLLDVSDKVRTRFPSAR